MTALPGNKMNNLARAWSHLPQISQIHASGDGRWAFWCWSGLSETDEVWCAPTDGSAPPERLTFGDGGGSDQSAFAISANRRIDRTDIFRRVHKTMARG